MKKFLILLLFPLISLGQNKIDPPSIITDTTAYYDILRPNQDKFFIGWNWGTPGKKLDDAMYINMYHGYPKVLSGNNDDYADNISIVQPVGGGVVSGRPSGALFNSQSLYLEPTIKVINPESGNEFFPTQRNKEGAVFGFQKRNKIKLINDPIHPEFGRVLLYKDSVTTGSSIVLDSIWPRNLLRFYNYVSAPIINLPKMNGKEMYVSINLKSLEPITNANPNDIILTIKLPYKVWDDKANSGNGGYFDSNFVKFRNLPKVSGNILNDTIQIRGSRGDWRGIKRDTADSLNYYDNIREFNITAAMLNADGNGTADINITLSAFTYFIIDSIFSDFKWNPLLKPDWHGHGKYTSYIKDLDVEVTYHGKLDIAIDWIRLETPRAKDIYEGKHDITVYTFAKAMMKEITDEPYHNPKMFKFYASDELLPHQWGLNRYYNLLLDTLASSETGLSNNPAGHYIFSTGFKEYWTGDNIRYLTDQAVPFIKNAVLRDSAIGLSGSDTIQYSESPESLNYKFGYKGYYRRKTHINNSVNEWYDYPINDSLNSDYETFIDAGVYAHKTIPFPSNNWPFDSIQGVAQPGFDYQKSSTQFQIEYNLNEFYRKQSRMLFDNFPWWANLWVISETWNHYPDISSYSIGKTGQRPKTGEETSLMSSMPVLLGTKGLLYWFKTEDYEGFALGLQNQNKIDSIGQSGLDTGENLIYSDTIGGDFIKTNDAFKRTKLLRKSELRLDKFNHDSTRIYIGTKSTRAQLYKIHKWITSVDNELMDLQLQAWHGKGYKEWELWNQYNHYKYWDKSPLRRLVTVDSVRTRKIFEPKYNSNHNFNPGYENRDSSFFDITLLQDKYAKDNDLYNRKKSVYLGIQNRRTDPLIYRDSNFYQPPSGGGPPPPIATDWRGELMFFSSAEMDSNVRYGGKDLWGVNQDTSWWKEKWWQRLGVRELSIPFNIPVYGNGTYVIAEELGLEKMDTLGWWFSNDLYHRVDTVLNNGDKLLTKLLPGQGKIIKVSYVPYFFNDPTKDSDTTNDHCYFCDIFNDFDMFDFNITKISDVDSCCYQISFTYNGDCTFEDIPLRLIFNGTSGNSFNDIDHPGTLLDSAGTNIKYKNFIMDLDSNTGTEILGTYCVPNDGNSYKISLLAGKDKDAVFIGCDRELQFGVKCGEIVDPKDCCEDLIVTDSLYKSGTGEATLYCSKIKIDTGFDSDCIFGVSIVDSNGYVRVVIPKGFSAIDFTSGIFNEFTFCYQRPPCYEISGDSLGRHKMKMQFLGKDGTIICEKEVTLWLPCDYIGIDDLDFTGGPAMKNSKPKERPDSKTYESDSFKVTVWPNPTSGELNVEIDSKVDTEVDINFINNIGANITNENGVTINKGVNEKTYNLKNYSSGVYYLQINGRDGNIVLPIMLNK